MLYMPITIIIFAINGQVNYILGGVLGIGTVIGARLAVVTSMKKGSPFIRYILLFAIFVSVASLVYKSMV